MYIQCLIKGEEYFVCSCLLAYMGIIEFVIKQRAREEEEKDESIYSGNRVVHGLPYIMHTN